jgi:hypothetical protein
MTNEEKKMVKELINATLDWHLDDDTKAYEVSRKLHRILGLNDADAGEVKDD